MDHGDLKSLISAYCLDALNENEKQNMEAHLNDDCFMCESLLNEMRAVTSYMLCSVDERPPSFRLKKKF